MLVEYISLLPKQNNSPLFNVDSKLQSNQINIEFGEGVKRDFQGQK